jgi:hypothetical protein
METVAKYNNLVNQHPKHMTLIETLFHQGTLRQMLVRLSKEKIDFMSIPNEENGFACVSSRDVKMYSKTGFRLIEKDKIMLFGLTECLADKDIAFAKKIAKKIKCKALKKLAHSIIEDFEFSYQLEKMKNNGTEIIQL